MPSGANVVVYAGLLIGLVYGAVGLLSGFCLMSSLRGWWAQGDSRLIRSYALVRRGDRARHNSANDAERPGRADADRAAAVVANDAIRHDAAGAAGQDRYQRDIRA